jgi:hypothetical protein
VKAVAAAVLGLVIAGCGGGGSPERASATKTPPSDRVTPAEVRWVGRALDWTKELQAESEELMRLVIALDEGRTDDVGSTLAAIDVIDDRCTEPRLDRPVTRRLVTLHERLLHLCYHVGGAVEYLQVALDPSPGWNVTSASVQADIREFHKNWKRGLELARQAGRDAAKYAPTNARKLSSRGSGSHVSRPLGRVASELAGEEAVVQCWSARDWRRMLSETGRFLNEPATSDTAGFVLFGDHRINLPADVCTTLERGRGDDVNRAFALATLAHEARHVSGTVNETTATCQSIDDLADAARLLGLGGAEGRELAAVFRERVLPTMPRAYRAFEC